MHLSETQKREGLEAMVAQIKSDGEGKPYDCIIGLSGGVDSSYVAWLVKELGLRPLAVHFDNGWNSEIAVSNIEHTCKRLEIELFTYVVDWEEFKDIQLSFIKAGVANAEIPTDHGIFAILFKLAIKFNVKYILDGWNNTTEFAREGFTAGGWGYSDLRHLRAIHSKFGNIPLKTFPQMSLYKKAWWQKVRKIQQVAILNFIDYNKAEAIEVLKDKLGWKSYGGKHHESLFTKWHQSVYLITRFKFDKRSLHLSDLILSGQISRADALLELATPPISEHEKTELEAYVMKKLNINSKEYYAILNAPAVAHDEYPSDEFILKIYKKFKKLSPPNHLVR